jgi:hypothetical protein
MNTGLASADISAMLPASLTEVAAQCQRMHAHHCTRKLGSPSLEYSGCKGYTVFTVCHTRQGYFCTPTVPACECASSSGVQLDTQHLMSDASSGSSIPRQSETTPDVPPCPFPPVPCLPTPGTGRRLFHASTCSAGPREGPAAPAPGQP